MKMRWTILSLVLVSVVMTGCVGIPQRVKDSERPGYWKCTATDIGAGIHYFPVYTIPALIDLPFGFVVDVVCLPFDARNTRKQEADRAFWLEYFHSGRRLVSAEDGRARLSFMGREAVEGRIAQSSPPLSKDQLADLVAVGFAMRVAESQVLDEELILSSIGITNIISDGLLAQRVARNPGTPLPILERMVEADVALPQLIGNPNMTPALLVRVADIATKRIASGERLFQGPMSAFPYTDILNLAREALARNPSTPASTLESLAREPTEFTVKALAENPNTPHAILLKIASDGPNPYIKKLAAGNLARREEVDRKSKGSNQAPEDTARKLADPQR